MTGYGYINLDLSDNLKRIKDLDLINPPKILNLKIIEFEINF